ncbi:MAG: hypothetical protein A2202_07300 [Bdellovibrionales bacterium RIFOXYA1_FULL_36_14]|nr:MAG: hypothetical protein A2202_07300 [Bdellovibrionales bacterium RIFOXYA1_FULL_36_14]
MNILKLPLVLILVLIFSSGVVAKDRNGDSFRIAHESTFPQGESHKKLNGLQVMSRPLPGEPYFPSDIYIKKAVFEINDDYEILLNVFPKYQASSNNIHEIDSLISHSGKSNKESWSHHALPTQYGGLAYRYLDEFFQNNLEWEDLFHEYEKYPPELLIDTGNIDILSPIEKYEYLIGNTNFSMTKNEWQKGQDYINQFSFVPHWIGLCHGTAPATLNSPRPTNAIKVKSYNGKHDIIFYPSDLKELLSYAWAMNSESSVMLGSRCGSVVYQGVRPESSCLDPNPSAFHLATLNLLGQNNQSFIIDSFAGNEIWNRSIISYRYKYFKPGTHNFTDNLQYALTLRSDYPDDPFAIYRSLKTVSLVGVWMELTYIVGTQPSDKIINTFLDDVHETLSFWYDLEIDQGGNIIGGEWQDLNYPDFLWVVGDDILPKSFYDFVIEGALISYDGTKSLPIKISNYAKLAAKQNQLLFSIIESMLRLSQNND